MLELSRVNGPSGTTGHSAFRLGVGGEERRATRHNPTQCPPSSNTGSHCVSVPATGQSCRVPRPLVLRPHLTMSLPFTAFRIWCGWAHLYGLSLVCLKGCGLSYLLHAISVGRRCHRSLVRDPQADKLQEQQRTDLERSAGGKVTVSPEGPITPFCSSLGRATRRSRQPNIKEM